MSYSKDIKQQAVSLRTEGYSFHEIAATLSVPQGTVYAWTHAAPLSETATQRLQNQRQLGLQKAIAYFKNKREQQNRDIAAEINPLLQQLPPSTALYPALCSFLYWAEGSKQQNRLVFTNADPRMMSCFLYLLRNSFLLDETKFRAIVHIHEYHNPQEIMSYWSEITHIPLNQFIKPYCKPHTGKNIHPDFKGTCSMYYYDARLAKKLTSIYRSLTDRYSTLPDQSGTMPIEAK
jgi:transposase-like protein